MFVLHSEVCFLIQILSVETLLTLGRCNIPLISFIIMADGQTIQKLQYVIE